jgi:hypothetical protein
MEVRYKIPASSQHTPPQAVTERDVALHDLCLRRNPLFIGLLSHLADALQEDTEKLVEKMQVYGQTILAKDPAGEKPRQRIGTEVGDSARTNATSAA